VAPCCGGTTSGRHTDGHGPGNGGVVGAAARRRGTPRRT
jgi:hypothetical protein